MHNSPLFTGQVMPDGEMMKHPGWNTLPVGWLAFGASEKPQTQHEAPELT